MNSQKGGEITSTSTDSQTAISRSIQLSESSDPTYLSDGSLKKGQVIQRSQDYHMPLPSIFGKEGVYDMSKINEDSKEMHSNSGTQIREITDPSQNGRRKDSILDEEIQQRNERFPQHCQDSKSAQKSEITQKSDLRQQISPKQIFTSQIEQVENSSNPYSPLIDPASIKNALERSSPPNIPLKQEQEEEEREEDEFTSDSQQKIKSDVVQDKNANNMNQKEKRSSFSRMALLHVRQFEEDKCVYPAEQQEINSDENVNEEYAQKGIKQRKLSLRSKTIKEQLNMNLNLCEFSPFISLRQDGSSPANFEGAWSKRNAILNNSRLNNFTESPISLANKNDNSVNFGFDITYQDELISEQLIRLQSQKLGSSSTPRVTFQDEQQNLYHKRNLVREEEEGEDQQEEEEEENNSNFINLYKSKDENEQFDVIHHYNQHQKIGQVKQIQDQLISPSSKKPSKIAPTPLQINNKIISKSQFSPTKTSPSNFAQTLRKASPHFPPNQPSSAATAREKNVHSTRVQSSHTNKPIKPSKLERKSLSPSQQQYLKDPPHQKEIPILNKNKIDSTKKDNQSYKAYQPEQIGIPTLNELLSGLSQIQGVNENEDNQIGSLNFDKSSSSFNNFFYNNLPSKVLSPSSTSQTSLTHCQTASTKKPSSPVSKKAHSNINFGSSGRKDHSSHKSLSRNQSHSALKTPLIHLSDSPIKKVKNEIENQIKNAINKQQTKDMHASAPVSTTPTQKQQVQAMLDELSKHSKPVQNINSFSKLKQNINSLSHATPMKQELQVVQEKFKSHIKLDAVPIISLFEEKTETGVKRRQNGTIDSERNRNYRSESHIEQHCFTSRVGDTPQKSTRHLQFEIPQRISKQVELGYKSIHCPSPKNQGDMNQISPKFQNKIISFKEAPMSYCQIHGRSVQSNHFPNESNPKTQSRRESTGSLNSQGDIKELLPMKQLEEKLIDITHKPSNTNNQVMKLSSSATSSSIAKQVNSSTSKQQSSGNKDTSGQNYHNQNGNHLNKIEIGKISSKNLVPSAGTISQSALAKSYYQSITSFKSNQSSSAIDSFKKCTSQQSKITVSQVQNHLSDPFNYPKATQLEENRSYNIFGQKRKSGIASTVTYRLQ